MTLAPEIVEWAIAATGAGANLLSIDRLPPASTELHVLALGTHRGVERLVVRRYHDRERLAHDFAYAPANEAAALALLGRSDVPSPDLLAADIGGLVSGAPLLLESWVPGEAAWSNCSLDSYLRAAAEVLVRIHDVALPADTVVMPYRPYQPLPPDGVIARGSERPELWDRVREALAGEPPPATPSCFIHRDYHPGNALWDGAAVHVVDWTTAAIGPRGIDLARMRQNLAAWQGAEVADRFGDLYVAAGGAADARHPYWDLLDAAELAPDTELEAPGAGVWSGFEDYVARVVSELG